MMEDDSCGNDSGNCCCYPGPSKNGEEDSNSEIPEEAVDQEDSELILSAKVGSKRRSSMPSSAKKSGTSLSSCYLRVFQKRWLSEFEWLRYDAKSDRMHCKWCVATTKKNTFAKEKGSKSFRRCYCVAHAESPEHLEAISQLSQNDSVNSVKDPPYLPLSDTESSGDVLASSSSDFTKSSSSFQIEIKPASATFSNKNQDVKFHAKKALMLLSGFVVTKELPASLTKELIEIFPFMFPDSEIAQQLTEL